jgi:predicted PurR-regulated permease PerM
MKQSTTKSSGNQVLNPVIHSALQLLALSLLIYFCFEIIKPFITLLIWGVVLAITLYKVHLKLTKVLWGRKWISAVVIMLVMYLLIIGPAVMLMSATIDEFKVLSAAYKDGNLGIPPPNENVKDWPLIGETLFTQWSEASADITEFMTKNIETIKPFALKLVELLSSAGMGILLLIGAILVSGFMMVYGEKGAALASTVFSKLMGKHGQELEKAVAITVRNVAKGVIGVAFIQGILAGTGMVLAGVPLAGLWALIGMVLCIVQLGIMPVSLGAVIYVWSTGNTTTAILFTIWMLFIGVIDNILKPLMMGLKAPAPMLVVFMGTIGGFILNGFIGLFTGAIVLTVGYTLFSKWINLGKDEEPENELNDTEIVSNQRV